MSEEETIKNLEEFLKGPCEICKYCDGAIRNHRKAIQGLLDLYNKEKEKNKELENLVYQKLKLNIIENGMSQNDYISKDKIKELLNKYKPNQTNTFIKSQENYIKLVKEIQELLEERN